MTVVAEWLQVSTAWVRDHSEGSRRPVMPAIKLGRVWRYERAAVEEWLKALERAA